ncbi:MAG: cytochrome b5 domain-containing protein [Euzebya sp.]
MTAAPPQPVPARATLDRIEREGAPHRGAISSSAGFLPATAPAQALPASHRAWDEGAADLPRMWRDLSARRDLKSLPLLPAGEDELADADLWRASVTLSGMVYAYVRCDVDDLHKAAPTQVPDPLAVPWQQVAQRMGRRTAHVALDDLVLHNWRLLDPEREDPFRVDNMALLLPQTGHPSERAFFLTFLEMAAQMQPLVSAIIAGQEAVAARDSTELGHVLLIVLERIRHITEHSFAKLDPVALSDSYADPAVWAKLVAPTGIPVVDNVPGVSGAAAAQMQALDAFLGRTRFETFLGKEAQHLLDWYAPNVRDFVRASGQMPLREYVADSGSRGLQGLLQSLVDAYAGDRGYLGVHRRKVYGFIQTAFKVGRPSTASGISGLWRDRAWRAAHHALEDARLERYRELHHRPSMARLAQRIPAGKGSTGDVEGVVLDITDSGLVHRPGDRVAVTPTNAPDLIQRTLDLLRASGTEVVPLPPVWQLALQRRTDTQVGASAPLSLVLQHAWLRPLSRAVTRTLYRLSGAPALRALLESRREDTWEFPDALEALATGNFAPSRLWQAALVDPEALTRILMPAAPRLYSVAGAPTSSELSLTVGRLEFASPGLTGERQRHGTGSGLLAHRLEPGGEVPVEIVRPQRFSLPADPATPIIMIAAGTGIAPFMGFVQARTEQEHPGPAWLLLATRSPDHVPHLARLQTWVAQDNLRLDLACSRIPENPRRIDGLIAEQSVAGDLWQWLATDDGHLYICGQGGFAAVVMDALRAVAREQGGLDAEGARGFVRQLTADRRLQMDVFTTFHPSGVLREGERLVDTSELALHNDDEHGWWTEISGVVYDVTEFRHLHPGGHRIVDDNAAVDATSEYEEVRHHLDPEIEAMLAMYRIGLVRRLELAGPWGPTITDGKVVAVSLEEFYRLWVRELHTITELQNSLRNDISVLGDTLTNTEQPDQLTALKVGLFVDLQQRVLAQYLPISVGSELSDLWAMAAGLTDVTADTTELRRQLAMVMGGTSGAAWSEISVPLRALLTEPDPAMLRQTVDAAVAADLAMFAAVKEALRSGITVFETHESATLSQGGPDLLNALRAVPDAVSEGRRALARAFSPQEVG